jgi:flagellar hook-associated protein 2
MATLTAQGLGSGLDISGLVTKLVSAEGDTKKAQLTNQETKLTAEFSAIGTLKSALASVQSSLAKIDQASDFAGVKATAADPELFSATADTDAATGQYQIESLRLAQAHKLASATFASDQTFGGTQDDSLTLTVNGGSLKLDLSGGKTLAEIRDAINAATDNPGVQATLVNAGDGQQALVLTSKQTGYDNRIEVAESLAGGESLSLATVNRDADGNTLADLSSLDAAALVDGITVTSSTNELTDAIDGVTITLMKAAPGTQSSLSVGLDTGTISSNVSAFVQSYNALVKTLGSLSGYQGEGATQPALFGDSMTRSVGDRLRSTLGSAVSGLTGDVSSLSDIGITTSLDGSLTIDSAKFNDALSKDPTAVSALFTSQNGYASRLDSILSSYLDSGGILQTRSDGIQSSIDDIKQRSDDLDRRLADLTDRYTKQFNALDTLLGQLNSTSTYLTQQLDSLPGAYNPNSSSN